MSLLTQADISYYNTIENETEKPKKGLASYMRWGTKRYNHRTLILPDV